MALFDLLISQLDAVESADQFRAANAAAHGQIMAENGTDAEVKAVTREIQERAFPVTWKQEE